MIKDLIKELEKFDLCGDTIAEDFKEFVIGELNNIEQALKDNIKDYLQEQKDAIFNAVNAVEAIDTDLDWIIR